jgi:hypothetical protein
VVEPCLHEDLDVGGILLLLRHIEFFLLSHATLSILDLERQLRGRTRHDVQLR